MSSSTDPPAASVPPNLIKVGYVRRAHGVGGALIIGLVTEDPDRFRIGASFFTDSPQLSQIEIAAVQPHKDGLLAKLAGVADRTTAEGLRGMSLFIPSSDRGELGEDEFWAQDLIGLGVVGLDGGALGSVSDVNTGSAQHRLVVDSAAGTYEIPFVAAIVVEVDIASNRVVVDPPQGLIPS